MKHGPFDTNLDRAFKKMNKGQITSTDQLMRELNKKRDIRAEPFAVQSQSALDQFMEHTPVIPSLDPQEQVPMNACRIPETRKKEADWLHKELCVTEAMLKDKKTRPVSSRISWMTPLAANPPYHRDWKISTVWVSFMKNTSGCIQIPIVFCRQKPIIWSEICTGNTGPATDCPMPPICSRYRPGSAALGPGALLPLSAWCRNC